MLFRKTLQHFCIRLFRSTEYREGPSGCPFTVNFGGAVRTTVKENEINAIVLQIILNEHGKYLKWPFHNCTSKRNSDQETKNIYKDISKQYKK